MRRLGARRRLHRQPDGTRVAWPRRTGRRRRHSRRYVTTRRPGTPWRHFRRCDVPAPPAPRPRQPRRPASHRRALPRQPRGRGGQRDRGARVRRRWISGRRRRLIVDLWAEALVLPRAQCPAAVASAERIPGTTFDDLRLRVRRELVGTASCTHLNDTLRALADLGALLPGRSGSIGDRTTPRGRSRRRGLRPRRWQRLCSSPVASRGRGRGHLAQIRYLAGWPVLPGLCGRLGCASY